MYFLLIIIIVVGMPLSKFLMSLGTISIVVQWFLGGNIINKFKLFFQNRIAVITSIAFFIFLLGLIHTSNFEYGFKDIRIKVPLLTFPVIFSSGHKLKKGHFKWVLIFFISATFISTMYGYLAFKEILPARKEITDVRDISQFISHIRLSLMVILSMFILPILAREKLWIKLIGVLVFLWFGYFLSLIESATGFMIGVFTLFAVSIYISIVKRSLISIIPALFVFIVIGFLSFKLYNTYHQIKLPVPKEGKLIYTEKGNLYKPDIAIDIYDNGNYSKHYYCFEEMKAAWVKRSNKKLYEVDKNGHAYKFILVRYLTSKGYKKDYEGVNKLTDQDIKNIENGIPNYLNASNDLMSRLYLLMFEIDGYISGANVNGNSLAQRIEYWKTSKEIVSESFLFGQGTGDVPDAFKKKYENNNVLTEQFQLRSHNQYLSTFIALGFAGVVIFILTLILPLQYAIVRRNYFYFVFSCIVLLSFLSEDTLETQDGVYLFAFFNSLFLFSMPNSYLKNNVRKRRG